MNTLPAPLRGGARHFSSFKKKNPHISYRNKNIGEMTEHRESTLRAFNYMVSHQLKGPLTNARHCADMLEDHLALYPDATTASHVSHLRQLITDMKSVVDGLLSYAQADTLEPACKMVDTISLSDSIVHQLEPLYAHATKIVKVKNIPKIWGDPLLIRQAFSNLIENSLKFTKYTPKPTVTITGEIMGEHVIIRIEDNGAGFPPQEAEHIFDLFQSAHAHERDAYPGTGAGLMIVRRIVERHGGEIWAESQGAGEGAMFVMKWPSKSYGEEN